MKNLNLFAREMWNDLAYRRTLLFHEIQIELRETKTKLGYFHKRTRLELHDIL